MNIKHYAYEVITTDGIKNIKYHGKSDDIDKLIDTIVKDSDVKKNNEVIILTATNDGKYDKLVKSGKINEGLNKVIEGPIRITNKIYIKKSKDLTPSLENTKNKRGEYDPDKRSSLHCYLSNEPDLLTLGKIAYLISENKLERRLVAPKLITDKILNTVDDNNIILKDRIKKGINSPKGINTNNSIMTEYKTVQDLITRLNVLLKKGAITSNTFDNVMDRLSDIDEDSAKFYTRQIQEVKKDVERYERDDEQYQSTKKNVTQSDAAKEAEAKRKDRLKKMEALKKADTVAAKPEPAKPEPAKPEPAKPAKAAKAKPAKPEPEEEEEEEEGEPTLYNILKLKPFFGYSYTPSTNSLVFIGKNQKLEKLRLKAKKEELAQSPDLLVVVNFTDTTDEYSNGKADGDLKTALLVFKYDEAKNKFVKYIKTKPFIYLKKAQFQVKRKGKVIEGKYLDLSPTMLLNFVSQVVNKTYKDPPAGVAKTSSWVDAPDNAKDLTKVVTMAQILKADQEKKAKEVKVNVEDLPEFQTKLKEEVNKKVKNIIESHTAQQDEAYEIIDKHKATVKKVTEELNDQKSELSLLKKKEDAYKRYVIVLTSTKVKKPDQKKIASAFEEGHIPVVSSILLKYEAIL
jgi:hypothetical protein